MRVNIAGVVIGAVLAAIGIFVFFTASRWAKVSAWMVPDTMRWFCVPPFVKKGKEYVYYLWLTRIWSVLLVLMATVLLVASIFRGNSAQLVTH